MHLLRKTRNKMSQKSKYILVFLAGALSFWAYNKFIYKEKIQPELQKSSTIGIIGAMQEEVDLLLDNLDKDSTFSIAKLQFHQGRINGKKVVIVKSGIGKTNSAIASQILIDKFDSKTIINTGVAGALKEGLTTGDVLICDMFNYHDFDVSNFGFKIGEIPRMENSTFHSDILLSSELKKISDSKNFTTYFGQIVSGDYFLADNEIKEQILENFPQAFAIDMESASIAHTCELNNITYAVVRVISDDASESAKSNYEEFEKESAKKSSSIILDYLTGSK
jgi:adenosylhomocysteine nucleosidase